MQRAEWTRGNRTKVSSEIEAADQGQRRPRGSGEAVRRVPQPRSHCRRRPVLAGLGLVVGLRVPQGMWRFSGFGEVKRLALACVLLGVVGAAALKREATLVEQGGYLVGSRRPSHKGTPAELEKLAEANNAALPAGSTAGPRGETDTTTRNTGYGPPS